MGEDENPDVVYSLYVRILCICDIYIYILWVAKLSGIYMDTYFVREIMPTRLFHNFFNINPFLMIFVPFESSHSQLSNGRKIIKNGSISKKLWSNRVDMISRMK